MTAPEHEFVAYIDESGDPSLKRVRPVDPTGGTEWFTISAVLVRREHDGDLPKWVASINEAVGSTNSQIIHFTHLTPEQRLKAAELVASYPLRLFVVASNKKNMRQYRNERAEKTYTKQWFYNWMARILIERVTDYCFRYTERRGPQRRHVKFVFSQTGGHSYSQTAAYHELLRYQSRGRKTVLNKWVPKWEVMHWKLLENYPHYKRAGLQLADVVASAFYHAVDNLDTGPCYTAYAKALHDRIAFTTEGDRRDYGVVLQPTPDWAADITEDQREIFRFYGYEFKTKW
ncbi:DUF3800 domain-containing protein [Sinorhizobium meliloti]|uniref:DUF3800 domain-containing protein n=1 Tax=Rhizobium meliloti TaxID=382 RepID=UPI000FDB10F1|nr:DUF3800 domain-containing protein [Sinorhizobium meliloti]MCO6426178.1 DUF3800 domain-containing protein [Sinorhizobium meliloti]RVL27073.1 DUF3800 domain-containing protein [Sinorhizobium meliloti]